MITDTETERLSKGFAFADDLAIGFTCEVNRMTFDQIFVTFLMLVYKKTPFIIQKTLILNFYFLYKKALTTVM
ncbi:hypothetical protein [Flavobacterium xueshanense]|uniref:hypothetical protein n=1 Tax=Flavobacterium xueshanense TaxID=935223 RepID=UPI000A9790BB|nr:hypothetical protein [Flavobacterium xueshanense]